jgi:hypothetical protein
MTTATELDELGDLFFLRQATALGIDHKVIYRLRDGGELLALGGGLYRRSDAPPADLDRIEITERAPRATLCLETALAYHDLIDTIPASIDIALPRGSHRPKLRAPHRLHFFDSATFDLGRETSDVGARQPLGIYSAERSLIDVIRLRHDQGSDQAWEALRRWLARPGRNPARLIEMASKIKNAETPLRRALEVLL